MTTDARRPHRHWLVAASLACAGGLVGFLFDHYLGCLTGECGTDALPYYPIVRGAAVGFVLALPLFPEPREEPPPPPVTSSRGSPS